MLLHHSSYAVFRSCKTIVTSTFNILKSYVTSFLVRKYANLLNWLKLQLKKSSFMSGKRTKNEANNSVKNTILYRTRKRNN